MVCGLYQGMTIQTSYHLLTLDLSKVAIIKLLMCKNSILALPISGSTTDRNSLAKLSVVYRVSLLLKGTPAL